MILRFLLSLMICLHAVTSLFCYWNTGCPYKFFSSQTPYNMLRGDIRDSLVKITDCHPISIWALMRHGKTYPESNDAKSMKDSMFIKDDVISSYQNGNSSLCAQDVENLRNWVLNEDFFVKDGQLSDEGYQEMQGIGRRLLNAFPKLLTRLNREDYKLRAVKKKWAQDSMKAFIDGLGNEMTVEDALDGYDNIIPYETCTKYIRDVQQSDTTSIESSKYENSSEYLVSKDRIRRRLGIDYQLKDEHVKAMWDFCRYTSSGITNKFSPWCSLFTTDDLKVMEYAADLKHYYKTGYGTEINKFFGEIVISDLLKSFQGAKEAGGRKITGYITQGAIMDMVYTALGLFKDEDPLTSSRKVPDRKWRTSKISIFSNNLIAVLNKCGADGDNDYNVVFYINEEPLRTVCKDGVCTWREFENKLSPFLATNTDFCE